MSSNKKISSIKNEKKSNARGGVLKYLGLVIVALAVVGLVFSSLFSGGSGGNANALVFGRYGDKDIVYRYDNAFGQAVENEMAKYNNSVDQDNQFFNFIRLLAWQQAFSNVAVDTAISYHLDQSGYVPSSRAIDRRVVEFGPYRTGGEFDEEKYRAASEAAKNSVRERFEEQIILETWSRDVLDGQYRSDAQLDFLNGMKSTLRTYDYIVIPFSDYPDDDVIAYGKDNSEIFRSRTVSRITVSDEDTANEVVEKYNERKQDFEAFGALAGEYSQDAYKDDGGSMGETEYNQLTEIMSTDYVDQVFSLSNGEIAGPFDTDYGWIILRAESDVAAADIEAKVDDIRSYMLQNDIGIIEDNLLAKAEVLKTIAESGESFRTSISKEGFEVSTTQPFAVNYGGDSLLGSSPENTGDPALSGTASSEEFWNAIAPLDRIGEISRPIVLSDAVGLFALASTEDQEALEYWDSMVDYEIARSRQADFQAAILSDESKLFDDQFSEAYARIFPAQG